MTWIAAVATLLGAPAGSGDQAQGRHERPPAATAGDPLEVLGETIQAAQRVGSVPLEAIHEDVLYRGEPLETPAVAKPGSGETLAQVIYRARAGAVVAVSSPDGQGSGAIVRPEGYVLTCAHVLGNARSGIQVVRQAGTSYDARVLAIDQVTDLALLKIETTEPLPWIALADLETLEVGDAVVAIGHPKGFGWSVNTGIVSNLYVFRDGRRDPGVIQTQVPLNPGNSGGPLLDENGFLVGVVAQGDPSAQALNWCISARTVKRFLLENSGLLPRARLTVDATPADATVHVDGHAVGTGRVTLEVPAGPHVIEVRRPGLGDVAAPIVLLQRDEARMQVRLAPAGTLAVATDVPGVAIYVDGVLRGEAPLSIDVAEGSHRVSGVKDGSQTTRKTVAVRAGVETELALSHPQTAAFLTVQSDPAGAEVMVDGEIVGVTPLTDHAVAPGRHVVDVRRAGARPRRMVVDVTEAARRTVDFTLEPEFNGLEPAGDAATVSVIPSSMRQGSRSRTRMGIRMTLGGVALSAVSAALLATQDEAWVRGAAAASMVAGSTGFVIGPTILLREYRQDAAFRIEPAPGAGMSIRF